MMQIKKKEIQPFAVLCRGRRSVQRASPSLGSGNPTMQYARSGAEERERERERVRGSRKKRKRLPSGSHLSNRWYAGSVRVCRRMETVKWSTGQPFGNQVFLLFPGLHVRLSFVPPTQTKIKTWRGTAGCCHSCNIRASRNSRSACPTKRRTLLSPARARMREHQRS